MERPDRPYHNLMSYGHLLDEMRVRLIEVRRWVYDGTWSVQERIIPRPIFWYIEQGRIPIVLDGDFFVLEPGDVMLYQPATVLSATLTDAERPSLISVHFHAYVFANQEITSLVGCPAKPSDAVAKQVVPLIKRLHQYASNRKPTDSLIMIACLYEALAHVLENSLCKQVFLPTNPHVAAALHYIHSHLGQDHTVTSLAKAIGVSTSHLRGLFREHLEISPLKYIHWVRFNSACSLLADATTSIEEVAYALGFADANYFSRWFAKTTGCAPSVYRQRFLR